MIGFRGEWVIGIAENPQLRMMTTDERLGANYAGTGVNIGMHPMAHRRDEMKALGINPADELPKLRQESRPDRRERDRSSKDRDGEGYCLLSIEDEIGIANAVVMPDLLIFSSVRINNPRQFIADGRRPDPKPGQCDSRQGTTDCTHCRRCDCTIARPPLVSCPSGS